MPVISEIVKRRAEEAFQQLDHAWQPVHRGLDFALHTLVERVYIPVNASSAPGLVAASKQDPWGKSGKYALGWVYFAIILLVVTSVLHAYHAFTDRIRAAIHEEEIRKSSQTSSPINDYELTAFPTDKSTNKFFPPHGPLPSQKEEKFAPDFMSVGFKPVNKLVALFRFIFYRPIPDIRLRKKWTPIGFPSLSVCVIVFAGLAFSLLYTFVPQPWYYDSIAYGAPPLAIRAGMLAVAMMPWIVAMAMKANIVSLLTGIGHERLNVLHRWGAYICLILSLIHTIPFYVTPVWDHDGKATFNALFQNQHFYVYGTGIAALVPLIFLCVHSLPVFRRLAYELFLILHVPASIVYLGMLFWHCHNYLTSWHYLFATLAIWLTSYCARLFFLNWTNPFRLSWLVGDESAITVLPENAVKITVPTQVKWRPGQYVYIRMPGIAVFQNHPFTIASLCSEDFPSEYGEGYRDMILVFRPFGGFTKKVLDLALDRGPWQTYRAFLDGPYGGMRRRLESFDKVILIAGGSGVTALVSQLLDLIKRMRDAKAVTRDVQVIWALKRPETLEWFKEELRICRECAPPESVRCQFFITAAKRLPKPTARAGTTHRMTGPTTQAQAHLQSYFRDRVNDAFQGVAEKRASYASKRASALIREEAAGDTDLEKQLRDENADVVAPLPEAHIRDTQRKLTGEDLEDVGLDTPPPGGRHLGRDIATAVAAGNTGALDESVVASVEASSDENRNSTFDFGFPSTPTEFQKSLMRFAFLPAAARAADGWSTEYGRPDLPYMLRDMSHSFGKRTCVYVCGPPGMRVAVSRTVAELQAKVLRGENGMEEIFLHTENYAL
ncbi:hypothetical protein EJ06DRAFT_487228 [Trichodelitschia bisporula]|uniref:ferric-chelate reductase (NADPH) n=1 Tax=Trichodelitschia bisporula TaxID=703511 RepID=A0A6G1I8L2_9PEZI|nr:hypothetical protein EJ06DRAFT_487228 [Trichodelitschia bisporula]